MIPMADKMCIRDRRYSVHGILEAVGDRRLAKIAGLNRQKVAGLVDYLGSHTDYIPCLLYTSIQFYQNTQPLRKVSEERR